MKLEIAGKTYDLKEALQKPSLLTLMELQAKAGVGMKSLVAGAQRLQGMDAMDILDDVEALRIFASIIWLARRHSGEKITFEESAAVPLDEYRWNTEESIPPEAEAEVGPTQARTVSARAGKRAPAAPRDTSTTSKRRSSSTSSP